jgi:hypothetical protein
VTDLAEGLAGVTDLEAAAVGGLTIWRRAVIDAIGPGGKLEFKLKLR